MKRLTMAQRLRIPIDGDPSTKFYTRCGLLLAHGYSRVVIGGRGPYIEFEPAHIMKDNIHVPKHALHKLKNSLTYYHEYRSKDESYVKLYFQQMEVSYADYVVGKWYIDPMLLKTDDLDSLLLPQYFTEAVINEPEDKKSTLFD